MGVAYQSRPCAQPACQGRSNETPMSMKGKTMPTQAVPTAQEIMNRQVQTVPPDMPLSDVVAFLLKNGLSNAPVVSQEGDRRLLLGFVSEGDCLEFLCNELVYGNPSPPQRAETIMKKHPTCVDPQADVFTISSILTNHRYRHLPVVQDGCLLGIVSRCDILKSLDKTYRDWIRTRDRERFPVDTHKIMNHRFIVLEH